MLLCQRTRANPDGQLEPEDEGAADQVGQGAAGRDRGAGHRQGAEAVEHAFGAVVVEPICGGRGAEDGGLGEDAGDVPVHVLALGGGWEGGLAAPPTT
jgi:hypothetical protein